MNNLHAYFLHFAGTQRDALFQNPNFMTFWNGVTSRVEIPGMQGGYLFQSDQELPQICSLIESVPSLQDRPVLLLPIDGHAIASLGGSHRLPGYLDGIVNPGTPTQIRAAS